MGLAIHRLGVPRVLRDGVPVPGPRGRKAWALLAYLVLAGEGAGRAHLAGLLFEDAEDPLGALRWNLSELRRVLGDVGLGGPDSASTPERVGFVDVDLLARGAPADAVELPG
jgi:DNA-binding SARP family transcriptional activator